jgi:hypothetical protein
MENYIRDNRIETDSKIFPITFAGARLVGVIAPRAKSRFAPLFILCC